eukprot:CAMPEP_0184867876 /NCGR_PEP_ID=MMETSP0580-20130426/28033_1 /TAXON_ID=1118495 /ORGANISM="Dactyliosolen fragilissimus" /LENGTH=129 /DNA_ID=CAMNT_0027368359 /DNA_START=468 /DNA_END=857 /DNA_ORIENTATION=+
MTEGYLPPENPGILLPTISSVLPNTEGVANLSLHLFSIKGDTAADVPFGQKTFDFSEFIGATSCNAILRLRAFENSISPFFFRSSQSFSRLEYAEYDAFAGCLIAEKPIVPIAIPHEQRSKSLRLSSIA